MRKNILSIKLILVFLCLCFIFNPTIVNADVTVDGIHYVTNKSESAYDIKVIINGSSEVGTTYSDAGYRVYFSTNENNEKSVVNISNGGVATLDDGVSLKITGSTNGSTVNVSYEITNNSEEQKSFKISTTADIKLGSNDRAAVFRDGHDSLQITQDNSNYSSNYGVQVKLNFSPAASTSWIGNYSYRYENRYTDSTEISYTYADDVDTGLAYSWQGTLEANETKVFSAAATAQIAEGGTVNFYPYGSEECTSKSALIGGSVVTPAVSASEEHYTYAWNTKTDGSGTSYNGNAGIIVTSSVMNLYEVKVPNVYTVSLDNQEGDDAGTTEIYESYNTKYSLTSGGDAMTSSANKITIPTKTGYKFCGYYTETDGNGTQFIDENGFITNNADTTYFEDDGILYAKWVIQPGDIYVIEPEIPNANEATFAESGNSIIPKINFTESEISEKDNGKDIDIFLEVIDITNTVSEDDKNAIQNCLNGIYSIGQFLDVSLYKKLTGEDPIKITETKDTIKISFVIPDYLINTDPNITRKYKIIRLHDGVITYLDTTVDGNVLTFETDKFSTYALAYADETIQNPQTGDNINLWIVLSAISSLGLVGTQFIKRKIK